MIGKLNFSIHLVGIVINFILPLLFTIIIMQYFAPHILNSGYTFVSMSWDLINILSTFVILKLITKPRITNLKPLILLPYIQKILFKQTLATIFLDPRNLLLLSLLMGIYGNIYSMHLSNINTLLGIFNLFFLWIIILLGTWELKIRIKYSNDKKWRIILYYIISIILLSVLQILIIPTRTIFIIITGITYIIHFRNRLIHKLQFIYDSIDIGGNKNQYKFRNTSIAFIIKEYRMVIRSKRLKITFILSIVFSITVLLLSFELILNSDNINVFLYIAFMSIILNPDYYERFWAWDRKNINLIKLIPNALNKYISQKLIFSVLLLIPLIIFHIIFFYNNLSFTVLFSLVYIIALPIFGGFSSSYKELNSDLDKNIWEISSSNLNINMMLIIVPIMLFNWYLTQLSIVYTYLFTFSIIIIGYYCSVKVIFRLKNKEY